MATRSDDPYHGIQTTVLSARMAVRKRPQMYFGVGRDSPELAGRALWWVVRDALTETPVGPCLHVHVLVESDLVFVVQDDGPGLSTDPVVGTGRPWIAQALTELAAGHGPPRGTDLAVVTAVCGAVTADVWRGGRHYRQWADREFPAPPTQEVGSTDLHGTRLRFHLDAPYLGSSARLPADVTMFLHELEQNRASPNPAQLSITDLRLAGPRGFS